jgi:glyoxylase-like metal-dependent hydrolase (beta-lactamase superfamily II)
MRELAPDVRRLTFQLPLGIDHAHCYFVRGESGAWMLVDTAVAYSWVEEHWRSALGALDGPVETILVTHYHPDHVGGAALAAELTGAPVYEGRDDFGHCLAVWSPPYDEDRFLPLLRRHRYPLEIAAVAHQADVVLARHIRFEPSPVLVDAGDRIDGWEAIHLPGHAPGHLAFMRDGLLVSGDVLLAGITPNVSLDLQSGPDPLGDYLQTLDRLVLIDPRIALPGHGSVIDDPAGRAREIVEHHHQRLALTAGSLAGGPRTAYEASLTVFPDELPPFLRRFAFFETLAHLEYLALRGAVERLEHDDGTVSYLSERLP